jgi:hypothetical protein
VGIEDAPPERTGFWRRGGFLVELIDIIGWII